jgi:hypothetical protein
MSNDVLPVLFGGTDYIYGRLRDRLDGLTVDEYLWEPVGDVWSVRDRGGTWVVDGDHEERDPAPVTTIAWRMWHIADCLASYVTPHFGDWPLEVTERDWYADVKPAMTELATSYQVFRDRIAALGEDGIWTKMGPAWGPYSEEPWAALVVHALDELTHHGAEIALLRDLYARLG